MLKENQVSKNQHTGDFLQKIHAFRKIFSFEKTEVIKKKFNNKEATDEMNIFQCPFPDCKRNYFNLKDWGVHYRYHVYLKIIKLFFL